MDFLSDLRAALSGAGRRGLVAGSRVRSDPWNRSVGDSDGTASRFAPAHGQRTARPGSSKPIGTAGIPCASLWCTDAADNLVVARGLRPHPGSVLPVEVS